MKIEDLFRNLFGAIARPAAQAPAPVVVSVQAEPVVSNPPAPGTVVTFEAAFERLIGHEGGYVNHPDDPGLS